MKSGLELQLQLTAVQFQLSYHTRKFIYIAEAHAMSEWPLRNGRFNRNRGPVIVKDQPTAASVAPA